MVVLGDGLSAALSVGVLFLTYLPLVVPALPGLVWRLGTSVPALVNGLGEDVIDIFSRTLLLGTLTIDHFP